MEFESMDNCFPTAQDDSATTSNARSIHGPMAPTKSNREPCGSSRRSIATASTAAITARFQLPRSGTISAHFGRSLRKFLNSSLTLPVVAASAETRQETSALAHDVFDRHIFDRYLHFSSPEDEAEFRKREADAKKYIHDQLALGTPTGNLNAGGGELGYMLDAHAHGAGDSPGKTIRSRHRTSDGRTCVSSGRCSCTCLCADQHAHSLSAISSEVADQSA